MLTSFYKEICEENRKRYGTEFERVLRIIINQYSDRTHFIYEILQNAEDANATHIKFLLENGRLLIYHNGRPFNEQDIEGVCGIANGTKEDGTRIGHFGIGFKSVYCYTEHPFIYSGKYHFVINKQLFPEEVPAMPDLDNLETCMILPFDKADVTPAIAFQEIRAALTRKINADSLLMLKNIADVEIRISGSQNVIRISKERYPLDKHAYRDNVFSLSVQTTYTNIAIGEERHHDADYLFFTDAEKEATAIIFNVNGKELIPVKNSKVYAYFPTAKEAHQNFYIHAPFDTTPARDNFKEGAEYGKHNIRLVDNLGRLICFAFTWMRDHHYLSASGFKNVFPIYEYEADDILSGLYQNSINIVSEEAIIPTCTEGVFKPLSEICIPLWGNIADVFDDDDLRRLTGNRKASWIAKEFTTEAYSDIRSFLTRNFKVDVLDWKDLVQKMDALFLREKTLGWMEMLTSRIESYCIRRPSSDSHYINAARLPLVRTSSREQICARDEEGRLQVYLNNPEVAAFRIDMDFLHNESVRSFYERALGIPEYNVEQETVENILPKYATKKPQFKTSSPIRENIEDLKTIKDAIYTNSSVLEKLADKYIVTDGKEWFLPSEVYLRSDEIRSGYSLVKDIVHLRYLDSAYLEGTLASLKLNEEFFRKIGCNYGIRSLEVSREEYLKAVRRYEGPQIQMDLRDRIFNKTYISKKLDWAFSYEGFPEVFEKMTFERSLSIARFLNPNVDSFNIQGDLVGANDQHFTGSNVDSMMAYSMLGLQLCFNKWIYVKDDNDPHKPGEVDVADIRPEYGKFAKRLIGILPFKEAKNAMTEWLTAMIPDKADLDSVKRLLSNPEELVRIAKAKAKSDAKEAAKKTERSVTELLGKADRSQNGSDPRPVSGFDVAPISETAKEKREKKLDEEFSESLDHFVSVARGLSFARRESSEEERQFLEQEYGGICQICQKQIIKYNGQPYFEAINIIKTNSLDPRLHSTMKRGWNSLCLCPNCAAEYNNCSKVISTIYEQVMNVAVEPDSDEAIGISIELPQGRKRTIRYSPRHILALQSAFRIFKEA